MYVGAVPCNGIWDSETAEGFESEQATGKRMGQHMVISFEHSDRLRQVSSEKERLATELIYEGMVDQREIIP